jgi:hypothetical protein
MEDDDREIKGITNPRYEDDEVEYLVQWQWIEGFAECRSISDPVNKNRRTWRGYQPNGWGFSQKARLDISDLKSRFAEYAEAFHMHSTNSCLDNPLRLHDLSNAQLECIESRLD